MAKVAYYPGCALEGSGGPYDRSTRALVAALGLKMENLADWNCCGAMEVKNIHPMLQTYMSARNLAIAQRKTRFDPWPVERSYELFPALRHLLPRECENMSGGELQMVSISRGEL